jgi:hypothetical protein
LGLVATEEITASSMVHLPPQMCASSLSDARRIWIGRLPLGTFNGLNVDGGVDVLMHAFARNVHSDDPAAQDSTQTGVLSD